MVSAVFESGPLPTIITIAISSARRSPPGAENMGSSSSAAIDVIGDTRTTSRGRQSVRARLQSRPGVSPASSSRRMSRTSSSRFFQSDAVIDQLAWSPEAAALTLLPGGMVAPDARNEGRNIAVGR
jgi:hypothetical protein